MKKTLILLLAFGFFVVSANAQFWKHKKKKSEAVPEVVLNNDVDSMSYALGMNVGYDFAKNLKSIPGGKSNIDLLIKGFTSALKGDSTLLSTKLANTYFRAYISKAQKADVEKKKEAGVKFLADNKKVKGVQVTPSGLEYKILTPADGPKPGPKDTVKVDYTGKLMDGTIFDSSVKRGKPVEFPLNRVIKGWSEGIQLMSVGAKYEFFIPANLAYGARGAGKVIPPYATLIFEVKLLGIKSQSHSHPQSLDMQVSNPMSPEKAFKKK